MTTSFYGGLRICGRLISYLALAFLGCLFAVPQGLAQSCPAYIGPDLPLTNPSTATVSCTTSQGRTICSLWCTYSITRTDLPDTADLKLLWVSEKLRADAPVLEDSCGPTQRIPAGERHPNRQATVRWAGSSPNLQNYASIEAKSLLRQVADKAVPCPGTASSGNRPASTCTDLEAKLEELERKSKSISNELSKLEDETNRKVQIERLRNALSFWNKAITDLNTSNPNSPNRDEIERIRRLPPEQRRKILADEGVAYYSAWDTDTLGFARAYRNAIAARIESFCASQRKPASCVKNKWNLRSKLQVFGLRSLVGDATASVGSLRYSTAMVLARCIGENRSVVATMTIKQLLTEIKVVGDGWTGTGQFDGHRGFYDWRFNDGKSGRTEFYLDQNNELRGQIRGTGINWNFIAARR